MFQFIRADHYNRFYAIKLFQIMINHEKVIPISCLKAIDKRKESIPAVIKKINRAVFAKSL